MLVVPQALINNLSIVIIVLICWIIFEIFIDFTRKINTAIFMGIVNLYVSVTTCTIGLFYFCIRISIPIFIMVKLDSYLISTFTILEHEKYKLYIIHLFSATIVVVPYFLIDVIFNAITFRKRLGGMKSIYTFAVSAISRTLTFYSFNLEIVCPIIILFVYIIVNLTVDSVEPNLHIVRGTNSTIVKLKYHRSVYYVDPKNLVNPCPSTSSDSVQFDCTITKYFDKTKRPGMTQNAWHEMQPNWSRDNNWRSLSMISDVLMVVLAVGVILKLTRYAIHIVIRLLVSSDSNNYHILADVSYMIVAYGIANSMGLSLPSNFESFRECTIQYIYESLVGLIQEIDPIELIPTKATGSGLLAMDHRINLMYIFIITFGSVVVAAQYFNQTLSYFFSLIQVTVLYITVTMNTVPMVFMHLRIVWSSMSAFTLVSRLIRFSMFSCMIFASAFLAPAIIYVYLCLRVVVQHAPRAAKPTVVVAAIVLAITTGADYENVSLLMGAPFEVYEYARFNVESLLGGRRRRKKSLKPPKTIIRLGGPKSNPANKQSKKKDTSDWWDMYLKEFERLVSANSTYCTAKGKAKMDKESYIYSLSYNEASDVPCIISSLATLNHVTHRAYETNVKTFLTHPQIVAELDRYRGNISEKSLYEFARISKLKVVLMTSPKQTANKMTNIQLLFNLNDPAQESLVVFTSKMVEYTQTKFSSNGKWVGDIGHVAYCIDSTLTRKRDANLEDLDVGYWSDGDSPPPSKEPESLFNKHGATPSIEYCRRCGKRPVRVEGVLEVGSKKLESEPTLDVVCAICYLSSTTALPKSSPLPLKDDKKEPVEFKKVDPTISLLPDNFYESTEDSDGDELETKHCGKSGPFKGDDKPHKLTRSNMLVTIVFLFMITTYVMGIFWECKHTSLSLNWFGVVYLTHVFMFPVTAAVNICHIGLVGYFLPVLFNISHPISYFEFVFTGLIDLVPHFLGRGQHHSGVIRPLAFGMIIARYTAFQLSIYFVILALSFNNRTKCTKSMRVYPRNNAIYKSNTEFYGGFAKNVGYYEDANSTYEYPNAHAYARGYAGMSPHSWRFLFFNARFAPDFLTYGIREFMSNIGHEYDLNEDPVNYDAPIGHWVPWRTSDSFNSNFLAYINSGPLNPKTAYRVWKRFSGNDPNRPLMILWNRATESKDPSGDIFSFPLHEDYDDLYLYTWESFDVKCGDKMYVGYMPIVQECQTRVASTSGNERGMRTHLHTFTINITPAAPIGENVVKECKCNNQCLDPVGTLANQPAPVSRTNPTHGLWSEDYLAVMTHLVASNDEIAKNSCPLFVLSKASYNKQSHLLPLYCASLLKDRAICKTHKFHPEHFPIRNSVKSRYVPRQRHSNQHKGTAMIPFDSKEYVLINKPSNFIGGKKLDLVWDNNKKDKNARTIRKLRLSGDSKTIDEIISGICVKYRLERSYVELELMVEGQHLGGRTNFGDATPYCVPGRTLRCNVCNLYPPLKFKWKRSICPSCTHKIEDTVFESGDQDSNLRKLVSHLSYLRLPGITNLSAPTKIMPADPSYKPKAQRVGLRINRNFSWQHPGYKLPRKLGRPNISAPSMINGIVASRRATVLNLKTNGIEEQTIKCRLFAQPETDPEPGIFEELFDFAVKYKLIGNRVEKGWTPMKFCPYDWRVDGVMAEELFRLNLATKHNIRQKLDKMKSVLDTLNAEVWHHTTWNLNDQTTSRYWVSGFEPRKKKIYYQALLDYKESPYSQRPVVHKTRAKGNHKCCQNDDHSEEEKPRETERVSFFPRVNFTFFLKRELQPHTCDDFGNRASLNPRVICNPDAWTQIVLGPYLKALTENLHGLWHKSYPLTYFGGLIPGDANTWLNKNIEDWTTFKSKYNVVIENDFSKFDCTYTKECFSFIMRVYEHWGLDVNHPMIKHIFDGWMRPCGRFRSNLLVSGPVMNASGRSDTALMNALVNGIVQMASYAMAEQGVTRPKDLNYERTMQMLDLIKIGVLGDDSLTFYREFPDIGTNVGDNVARFGFEARDMKVHRTPEKAVFLAMRPYPVIDNTTGCRTTIWGPTMRKLNKVGISVDVQENPYEWLYQATIANLVTSYHVPFLKEVTIRQLDLLKDFTFLRKNDILQVDSVKYKHGFLDYDTFKKLKTNPLDWSPRYEFDYTYLEEWLSKLYGAGVDEYHEIIDMVSNISKPTCIYYHPLIERMIKIDTGS